MKIVIAPDSFKESLSASEVADCIQQGFQVHFPDAEYHLLPIADGGEGTLDALLNATGGEKRTSEVEGPLGEMVKASWGLIDNGKKAVIELAEASGLALVPPEKRNPELASTFGTGELIREALDAGVEEIILGLGGSATNDAGGGIAQALGVRLLDSYGNELERGGKALSTLAEIDLNNLHPKANQTRFTIACDVDNPLTGSTGASYIFGHQKGASDLQIEELDECLGLFADIAAQKISTNHRTTPGYGAAGGTALGLSLFSKPELRPGIDIILETVEAEQTIKDASLVITGEGQMDNQTLHGKAPFGVAKLGKKYSVPVIGIAGSIGKDIDQLSRYFTAIFGTVRSPQTLAEALQEAEKNLINTTQNIAANLIIGNTMR
ncbi:glycerate kinase [Sansalvadorimonas sp. 2012CJ34-2]|uniref:Glycerate kinase n=1 Tax=Parendozoicomonas callyspongiae TaxID=2942213 RepID=A0ABT0PGV5_9GAMM|nr:glycerate kinase [Sansalvadorimonas sp. 2012CJ34-2]MCL6270550.1 glycerate kinase [Sansalvadorimonas sp. 2012CJ34-2]